MACWPNWDSDENVRVRKVFPLLLLLLLLLPACRTPAPAPALFTALQPLCGKAFQGQLVEGTEPTDEGFAKERLVMHVRDCSAEGIHIGFHVGENRSRTWVLTRTAGGVRLKHDHRHEDGTEDRVSQYGGDTREIANPLSLDFYADEFTATLIPAAAPNIWTVAIGPGNTFTYAMRRDATGRRFRIDFDLTRPVAPPPPSWGAATPQSQSAH